MRNKFTEPPIIIGGCGRSGTTLLLSMLSAHPEVFCIPVETKTFCPSAYRMELNLNTPINTDAFYHEYFSNIPSSFKRWCEKTPRNVFYFRKIFQYFNGNVKLIHIVRDGRDVILSKHPKNTKRYWVSPQRWVNEVSAGLQASDSVEVYLIKYEALVLDTKIELKKLFDFLNLKSHKNFQDWTKYATVRTNKAWFGEVEPLFASSIGKWRKQEHRNRVAEFTANDAAMKLLEKLEYLN